MQNPKNFKFHRELGSNVSMELSEKKRKEKREISDGKYDRSGIRTHDL